MLIIKHLCVTQNNKTKNSLQDISIGFFTLGTFKLLKTFET